MDNVVLPMEAGGLGGEVATILTPPLQVAGTHNPAVFDRCVWGWGVDTTPLPQR